MSAATNPRSASVVTLEQIREYMRLQSEEDKKNRAISVQAESVPEALQKASIELGTPVRGLEYEILEKGAAGTLGVGRKLWKLNVYERSKEVKTSVEAEEETGRSSPSAARPEEKPKDRPGEVFVRIAGTSALLRVTRPQGKGPRATEIMALEKLSLRGISNFDPSLVSRIVKHADGEYVRVADVQYNPSHDAAASVDITDGEMKAVLMLTEPGPRRGRYFHRFRALFPAVPRCRARRAGRRAGGDRTIAAIRAAHRGGGRDEGP